MPINLDKDTYTPEEAHSLIQQHLGDEAAQQFRLYYNKIQKVPPHNVQVHKLKSDDDGSFEYRFKMEEYAQKIGIPADVLQFVMVPSERHGGGSQDNMGWLQIDFKTITSPEGNKLKVGVLDEIQSDFAQRISRLRQLFTGKMTEGDFKTQFEPRAWELIKNNTQLIEKTTRPEGDTWQDIKNRQFPTGDGSNVFQIIGGGAKTGIVLKDRKGLNYIVPTPANLPPYNSISKDPPPQDVYSQVEALYRQLISNPIIYQPTQLLKGIINRIESTSYSDIMKYLFNKALAFTKAKGCQQLWIPSSEMKIEEWRQNAQHGEENLEAFFKRVYDDNSVSYEAIKSSSLPGGGDFWVIDLGKVQDTRLAMLKLSNVWKSKDGMDRSNWKFYFDIFYKSYMQNYNPENEEDKKNEQYQGGTAYADDPGARMYEIMENFLQEMVPPQAYGDREFAQDFKSYLKTKYNFDLPPEFESKLIHSSEDGSGTWRPVEKRIPKQEVDLEAPSAEELNSMFKFNTKNRFSKAFKDKFLGK